MRLETNFDRSPFDHLSTDHLEKILECTCDIVKSIAIKNKCFRNY